MLKKISIWPFVSFALSLLLTIGVLTVFHGCEMKDDGTWMRCHAAQTDVAICGAVLCALFLVSVFVKSRWLQTLIGVIGITGGILMMFIPGGFVPMCMMNTMRCYTVMQPFVRIMGVLIAVFSVLNLIRSRKAVKKA